MSFVVFFSSDSKGSLVSKAQAQLETISVMGIIPKYEVEDGGNGYHGRCEA